MSAGAQPPTNKAPLDFNGDGKTDFSVNRNSGNGTPIVWWNMINGTGATSVMNIGTRRFDQPVPADYDGDGKTDLAMYRFFGSGFGNWHIYQSSTNTYRIENFGLASDNPTIVDDYDGDGKADLAVFRLRSTPGQAYFYYRGSLNNPNGDITYIPWGVRYGTATDQVDDPYTGDFDGDGKADFGVQRRADIANTNIDSAAIFYFRTAAGVISTQYFGWASDRIVPGDYDGDGKTDICVARGFNRGTFPVPTPIQWFIRHSNGAPDEVVEFGTGINFDFAQGDYDGDGKTDMALLVGTTGDPGSPKNFWIR